METQETRQEPATNIANPAREAMDLDEALPVEITVEAAAGLLQSDNPPMLLDVREACERAICKLDNDTHLPMGEVKSRWESLPRSERMLVLCHHGVRSLHVTHFLRDKGFDKAQSIMGGIAAWSHKIDPKVARY